MLIVSKFHDYYDTIRSYGIDKTVVYNRVQSEPLKYEGSRLHSYGYSNALLYGECRVIGFCGKLYPLLEAWDCGTRKLIYDEKQAHEEVPKSKRYYYEPYDKKSLHASFDVQQMPELLTLFRKFNAPVFVYGQGLMGRGRYGRAYFYNLIINPRLADWGFEHVIDPATAFQEIYMYISGVLGVPTPQTIDIDDKHKAIEKGHDGKYSFKKPPGGGQWR